MLKTRVFPLTVYRQAQLRNVWVVASFIRSELLFEVPAVPSHPLFFFFLSPASAHILRTNKKPWRYRRTNKRCSIHLWVLSNERLHLIITASRGLMEPSFQPRCTRCPWTPKLQSLGPAFLEGSPCTDCFLCQTAHQPLHWDLKVHFLTAAFPHVLVSTWFQRTVFVFHSTYFRKLHLICVVIWLMLLCPTGL